MAKKLEFTNHAAGLVAGVTPITMPTQAESIDKAVEGVKPTAKRHKAAQTLPSLEELTARLLSARTQGRRGCSMPKIAIRIRPDNLAFLADLGEGTLTQKINGIIDAYKAAYRAAESKLRPNDDQIIEDDEY